MIYDKQSTKNRYNSFSKAVEILALYKITKIDFPSHFLKGLMHTMHYIAFQRCIRLWGQNWRVWPGEAIFSKKNALKRDVEAAMNPDSLTLE